MLLVIGIEGGAGMLELDLGVEDDAICDGVGRQQHQARRIEAILPLAVGRRVLTAAVFDLAIGSKLEAFNRRTHKPEDVLVPRHAGGSGSRRQGKEVLIATGRRGRIERK